MSRSIHAPKGGGLRSPYATRSGARSTQATTKRRPAAPGGVPAAQAVQQVPAAVAVPRRRRK